MLLKQRITSAHRYFSYRAKTGHKQWSEDILDGSALLLDVPERMVYLDPSYWPDKWNKEELLGKRTFAMSMSSIKPACQSKLIWGYSCPFYGQDSIQIDHLFPYSLGGPTIPTNALYLCRRHNLGKSADVHLIPWEMGFSWADGIIRNLAMKLT